MTMERLTGAAAPDRTALGIVIILASVATMAFADAVVKLVSADLSLWQVFAARSLFAIPCLLALAPLMKARMMVMAPGWAALRSGLLVVTWLAFYASLPVLTLSVAAVAVYTNPIITALLSAAVIGEPVSRRQWLGVFVGFLGVIAVLKPGAEAFSWFTLLPLFGAVSYSAAMVLTRARCQREDPLALGLALHASFLIAGAVGVCALAALGLRGDTVAAFPFLLDAWPRMDAGAWALMALLGALSAAYFVGVARAYQIAPPSVIGTFDYAYLVSAAIWGFMFFAETPGPLTLLGMALITCAGLLVAARARA